MIMSKTCKNLLSTATLFFLFSSFSVSATDISLDLESHHGKFIKITIKNNVSRVVYDGEALNLDSGSKKIFSLSNAISSVGTRSLILDGDEFLWLFIRVPSRDAQGKGYCGAGTEDYLYLFNIKRSDFRKVAQFRLQSCLKNLSIGIDELEDIKESSKISFDQKTGIIKFMQEAVNTQEVTAKKITLSPTKLGITAQEKNFKN